MAFYACGINSTKYVSSASQAKRNNAISRRFIKYKNRCKNSDAKLAKLANKYPEWQFAISDLNSEDWKDKRDYLYKLFQQGSSLPGRLE